MKLRVSTEDPEKRMNLSQRNHVKKPCEVFHKILHSFQVKSVVPRKKKQS